MWWQQQRFGARKRIYLFHFRFRSLRISEDIRQLSVFRLVRRVDKVEWALAEIERGREIANKRGKSESTATNMSSRNIPADKVIINPNPMIKIK